MSASQRDVVSRKPRPVTPSSSEIQIQTRFRNRARIVCPGVRIVSIPNGGKRTAWAARQAKLEGMSAGFPDVLCLWPVGGIAAIEFKSAKGRLSEAQIEWIDGLSAMGFAVTVSRDADHALEFLRSAGAPFIDRVGRL